MPVALVIGNSDGIGLSLTESLLGDGWQVTGVSRSASRLAGERYAHHVIDVCHPDYPALLSSVVSQLPALTACVYCVGIGEFLELETLASERRVFETNLIGAVATAQVVIPHLLRAGSGHFLGLSSQADALRDGNAPSYAASKAGLSSYLEGLALACRPRGVSVTNLRFGFVDTKMAQSEVRPFMISPAQAAQRIRHCLHTRPVRDTFPKRMALLLWFVRVASSLRRAFS
ncbi:MAG TPA: SDR family NAD(P)-dependent oxidoreductase [Polyangiaceae bacterium]|nr:SDR family NAD(P)-dependent oxidoreductase [Polyangiaceae bacterium]